MLQKTLPSQADKELWGWFLMRTFCFWKVHSAARAELQVVSGQQHTPYTCRQEGKTVAFIHVLKNCGEAPSSTNGVLSWKENPPALVTALSSSSMATTKLRLTLQGRKKTEMKKELKASAGWEKAVAVIIGPETGSDRGLGSGLCEGQLNRYPA